MVNIEYVDQYIILKFEVYHMHKIASMVRESEEDLSVMGRARDVFFYYSFI